MVASLAGPVPGGHDPDGQAALIDVLTALERVKGAAAAAQARAAMSFADGVAGQRGAQGVPREQRLAGVGAQVALARHESPARGSRHLGLARALVQEMPGTLAALSAGHITEWTATLLVRATACLSVEHRRVVDDTLSPRLAELSDRQAEAAARAAAYALDPQTFVAQGRKAESDRRVTLRPAPDTMSLLSGLLPVADGVACHAALDAAAKTLRAHGDQRTLDQLRADILVQRLTGVACADDGYDVEIQVVMTDSALFDQAADPARMPGFGPIPADTARDLAFTGTTRQREQKQTKPDAPRGQGRDQGRAAGPRAAWIRRLFLSPVDGSVTDRDTHRRRFDPAVRDLLIARDQHCATPWCDAPIRHADHILRHAAGGPTTPDNGQGLCERCNYDKDTPDFTASADREPDGRRVVRLTTPTGHVYDHHPPPAVEGIADLHLRGSPTGVGTERAEHTSAPDTG